VEPAAAAEGVAGTWAVSAQIGGNTLPVECVLALQDSKITGTCSGRVGNGEVSGDLADTNITFQYNVIFNGMSLDFAYTGSIDPATNTMKGTVTVAGMTGEFSATRK